MQSGTSASKKMKPKYEIGVFLAIFLLASLSLPRISSSSSSDSGRCRAWLVQTIPTDMPDLRPVPGVLSTADVFKWLAGNASSNLDIIAQYWQLVARPDDPRSGDYGYSREDMQRFGAQEGLDVYNSLLQAADRRVNMRIMQHSGVYPDYTSESAKLSWGRSNVKDVTLLLSQWFGSGIIHAKVWMADHRHAYVGSANNDWKSLTQVKELGIYLVDCSSIVNKLETYFTNLWRLSEQSASSYIRTVSDEQWQVKRTVPCWSHFITHDDQCGSQVASYLDVAHVKGYPILSDPYMFNMAIQTPGISFSTSQCHKSYVAFSPPELSFDTHQTDEQAWIDTINSVGTNQTLRINTMDWLGQSQYLRQTVYWPSLSDAISKVVFSKHAKVKILVAYWGHFINSTDQYLKSLLNSNVLCSSSKNNQCYGKIEIKYYMVPGYNMTGPAIRNGNSTGNIYPDYTRVNHAKYAVSDVRANIGTSNLVWDYFYTTAGVSFGTYNAALVSQLQQIFEADWNSPYAVPVEEFDEVADVHVYSS